MLQQTILKCIGEHNKLPFKPDMLSVSLQKDSTLLILTFTKQVVLTSTMENSTIHVTIQGYTTDNILNVKVRLDSHNAPPIVHTKTWSRHSDYELRDLTSIIQKFINLIRAERRYNYLDREYSLNISDMTIKFIDDYITEHILTKESGRISVE